MTDTDIMERAERALANVQQQVASLTTTREQEAAAFEARKAQVVRVAHSLGTTHGIGEPLDDLLEEFGLPRRGHVRDSRAAVVVFLRAAASGPAVTLAGGSGYLYPNENTVLSVPYLWTGRAATLNGGPDCACSQITDNLMRWVRDAWPTSAPTAHLQIGAVSCEGSDCTHTRVTERPEGVLPVAPIPWVDPDRTA